MDFRSINRNLAKIDRFSISLDHRPITTVYCSIIDLSFYYTPPTPPNGFRQCFLQKQIFKMYLLGGGGVGGAALFISGIEVQCVSVSEHVWVGGSGLRGGMGLPAGGIRASQGTFSSNYCKK